MSDTGKRPSAARIISAILITLYTGACIYMYYRFMGWTEGSVYESDLPAHIKLAVDDGLIYSLISFILIALDKIHLMQLLPVILGAFACLSVLFTSKLITEVTDKKIDPCVAGIMALFLNVFMPCYIRGLSSGRYMGMHTASIWHNSTYLMMKWMGLWTLLIYLKIEKDISKKLTLKSFILFTAVLTLTTAAKPNFFLAVAPVMLVFLIIDLVKKNAPAGRLFLFASSVIPSFLIMILQNKALYDVNAGNNQIIIAPGRAMGVHASNIVAVSFLSIAFPLLILFFHIKDLFKNRYMLFAWMSAGVGFMQYFLFSEEGARDMDANFSWGYAFTIILIFGISLILWMEDVKKFKTFGLLSRIYLTVSGIVLLYHTYCGILFFERIVRGVSYMMWG